MFMFSQLRFDGCVYAVKKTRRPIKGSQDENSAIREVCAHAVLGKHKHVVRYYSAWCETDRMFIQSGKIFSTSSGHSLSKKSVILGKFWRYFNNFFRILQWWFIV